MPKDKTWLALAWNDFALLLFPVSGVFLPLHRLHRLHDAAILHEMGRNRQRDNLPLTHGHPQHLSLLHCCWTGTSSLAGKTDLCQCCGNFSVRKDSSLTAIHVHQSLLGWRQQAYCATEIIDVYILIICIKEATWCRTFINFQWNMYRIWGSCLSERVYLKKQNHLSWVKLV